MTSSRCTHLLATLYNNRATDITRPVLRAILNDRTSRCDPLGRSPFRHLVSVLIKQLQQPKALKAVTIVLACATAALFYQIVRVILEDSRAILELSTYSITLDGPTATSERVAGTITLRNAGRSELTIREMRLSCNCIKVVVDSRKIEGRGQTTLHLSAVPSDVASKEVFLLIESDCAIAPRQKLRIVVNSYLPAVLTPSSISLGQVGSDYVKTAQSRLLFRDPDEYMQSHVEVSGDSDYLNWILIRDDATSGYILKYRLADNLPAGSFYFPVVLKGIGAEKSIVTFVTASAASKYFATPKPLVARLTRDGKLDVTSCKLNKAQGIDLAVTSSRVTSNLANYLTIGHEYSSDGQINITLNARPECLIGSTFVHEAIHGHAVVTVEDKQSHSEELAFPISLIPP